MAENNNEAVIPDQNSARNIARTVLESLIVMTVLVTSLILFILILSKRNLRKHMHLLLLSNLAMAAIIFGFLVRPGSIHEEIRSYELGHGYCIVYLLLLKIEWIVVPYFLWMLSIERLIALNEPENYDKRFSKAGRVAMILFPWILGCLLGVIINVGLGSEVLTRYASYSYDPYFDEYTQYHQLGCILLYSGQLFKVAHVLWLVLGTVIPFLGLVSSSVALLIIFCKKRGKKMSSGDDVPQVHAGSVVFCIALNMTFALVLTEEIFLLEMAGIARNLVYTHWFVCIGELMIAVLGLALFPEIRQALARVCGCGNDNEEAQALLEIKRQESEVHGDK